MKRVLLVAVMLLLVGWTGGAAQAHHYGAGLGIFSGVKLDSDGIRDLSHNFGFVVDLPLIETFHICPTADTYSVDGALVTDLALAFKFVVSMWGVSPYAAIIPGITTMADERRVHLAGAGGVYFHLVSNLYLLAQVEYKQMVSSDADSGTLHGQGGVLFRF